MLKKKRKQSSSFGNPFPIGECISDCFLKKIQFKAGTDEVGRWERVCFSFLKEPDMWVHAFAYNPRRSVYKNDYTKEALNVQKFIESILFVYLDGEEMLAARHNSSGLESFIAEINEMLKDKLFWKIPVELKTLPNKKGEATLPKFPYFIRKQGDSRITLKYSQWEQNAYDFWKLAN